MKPAEIKTSTRDYMSRTFSVQQLADDENIFERGFANSLFALQLVIFVEKQFGITVEDVDLDMGNFSSIDGITAFVVAKREQHREEKIDGLAGPEVNAG